MKNDEIENLEQFFPKEIVAEPEVVDDGPDRIIESTKIPELLGSEAQMDHLSSNLTRLDFLTGGFVFGDVIAVSAATGMGKSEFCRTLTHQFSQQGIMCLWFSFEETLPQFIRRFPEIPLFYVPLSTKSGDLAWLEERISTAQKKFPTKIIFIDHLHFLFDMAKYSGNISLEIGTIMRKLKELALKYNIIIFIIAHLKKLGGHSEPTMGDLRDSSFVGQESDFVLILWRNRLKTASRGEISDFSDTTTVSLQKNRRNGTLGRFTLKLTDGIFREVDGRVVDLPSAAIDVFSTGRADLND